MSHQLCSAGRQGMRSPFPAGLGLLPKLSRLQAQHPEQECATQAQLDRGIKLGWALLDTDKSCWALGGPLAESSSFHQSHQGLLAGLFCQIWDIMGLWSTFLTVLYWLFNNYSLIFLFQTGWNIFFNNTLKKNLINKNEPFLLLFF